MATLWDGAGNVVRTDGTRSGSNTWQQSADASATIVAADHDTHDEGFADSIEECLNRNSENGMLADLDLGGNWIKNHGGWRVKTSNESRTATTTYSDDGQLNAWTLAASTVYMLSGCLIFQSASTTPDAKVQLDTSSAFTDAYWQAIYGDSTNTSPDYAAANPTVTDLVIDIDSASAYTIVHLSGMIQVNSAATVNLQWAQNVSNGTATTLRAGSWIRLERV